MLSGFAIPLANFRTAGETFQLPAFIVLILTETISTTMPNAAVFLMSHKCRGEIQFANGSKTIEFIWWENVDPNVSIILHMRIRRP